MALLYLIKYQITNEIKDGTNQIITSTTNFKEENTIMTDEMKINYTLDKKADTIPLWDNTVKNELQIFLGEINDDNEIVINSNFLKIKKIDNFGDKETLFYIPSILTGTEIFSVNKKGAFKSYLRTEKYIFLSEPYKVDNNHYIWITDSNDAPNMTTLVCTDKNFNFLWDYSYNARLGYYKKPVYAIKDKGFITLEEGNVINFFDKEANFIWQYKLAKETKKAPIFVIVEKNNIQIFTTDMRISLDFDGKVIDEKIFPYVFLNIAKSEKFTYYQIIDNVERKKTANGLSYKLNFNNSKPHLLRENNKTKEKTTINYITPDDYGEFILVNDYCFYQNSLGGGKWELAIISQDKKSPLSIPSYMAIKPVIIDETIEIFFEPYFDDNDIYKKKNIILDKNGNILSENEIEIVDNNYRSICEVFKIDDTLYKVEIKEILNPKRKEEVMFWQFIISPYNK